MWKPKTHEVDDRQSDYGKLLCDRIEIMSRCRYIVDPAR